jgi:biotin transport system permease protein
MAQRITLHYVPGNSPLHRWDARCKFIGLLMVTATLLPTKMAWLFLDSGLLLSLLAFSRLPLRQFLRDSRTWAIFLLALFLVHAFFSPGSRWPAAPWIPVTGEGLRVGGVTCWRLALILGYAVLFTAVTRPRELQGALVWLLKPVPFLPERRVGLMVSLTLRFFSIILDQAEEVRLAHKTRLGDRHRNPFRQVKFLTLPVLRRSLFRAEDVTLALAARAYRDDIPLLFPRMNRSHVIPLIAFPTIALLLGWLWA